jgi:hypothetical protein
MIYINELKIHFYLQKLIDFKISYKNNKSDKKSN